MRLVLSGLVLIGLATTALGPVVTATDAKACTMGVQWEFQPEMGLSLASGEFGMNPDGTCVEGSTSPLQAGLSGLGGQTIGTYSGSCLLATFTAEGTSLLLIGGTFMVGTITDGHEEYAVAHVFPISLCLGGNFQTSLGTMAGGG